MRTAGHLEGWPAVLRGGVASVRGVVRFADCLADAAAGGDLVAVRPGPLADLRELFGVPTLRRAPGAGTPGAAADLPRGSDVVRECLAERVSVVIGEIDLVVPAIEREGHRAPLAFLDGVAGEIIDQVSGDFLHHGIYLSIGSCLYLVGRASLQTQGEVRFG